MKIEIWSDILCPFCYIGKRHFEMALSELPFKEEIEVEWKSYQLDPELTFEPLAMNKDEYLESRGYPKDQVQMMFDQLEKLGQNVGITFRQDISILVNSKRAHALLHFAAKEGKSSDVKEALFKAHFTDAKDIASEEVLKGVAAESGLNAEEAWQYIMENKADDLIANDIKMAQEIGVRGVPFFVIDRKYAISGAQAVNSFKEAITKAYDELQPQIQIMDDFDDEEDLSCGPDGCSI